MWPYVTKGRLSQNVCIAILKASAKDSYKRNLFRKGWILSARHHFNQYFDLITPLPCHVESSDCQVHIFYAKKMGRKYLKRYNNHFKNAIIHPQEYRHEELLVSYSGKWCQCIKQICLNHKEEV